MTPELLDQIYRNAVSTSVGASTIQKMGPTGTATALRAGLAKVNVPSFIVQTEEEFAKVLDKETELLRLHLLPDHQHFGTARKVLNIFLLKLTYNRHLHAAYQMGRIEQWLEVPLDSHVGKQLARQPGANFRRWKTVIGLTPTLHKQYQDFAKTVAANFSVNRADLDVFFYRAEK